MEKEIIYTIPKEEWEKIVAKNEENYESLMEAINFFKERLSEYETWEFSE
jgi:hypothetical protein